jgi:hypothetical protein
MTFNYSDIARTVKPSWPEQQRRINILCAKHQTGSELDLEKIKERFKKKILSWAQIEGKGAL